MCYPLFKIHIQMPYRLKVQNGGESPNHKCTTVSSYIKIN